MTQVGETMRGAREKLQVMFNAINLIENSGLCSSLLWKIQMYICGTLRFQSLCGDKTVAQEYEDYMRIKCGKGLDLTNRFGLRQMCMLDVKGMMTKGDIGTNIVRQDRELHLQGIEAERIGDPTSYRVSNNYVRGLRLDESGIVLAADIFYRDRMSGVFKFDQTIPVRDERGLPRFLFLVNPISYDDYRGVSVFKTAIDNATYIDRMREYELQALMWAASQSGIYHTNSGTLPEQLPFDRISPLQDESGNKIDTYQVRPNTVTAVGVGENVSMFQHDRPSPNVLGMVKDTIRDICVGVGVSFEFGWDMSGLSGPAVRGVSSQDARAFEVWQELIKEGKLDPVAGLLIGNAIVNGELPYHPKWNRWRWQFPAKSTIDAGRESNSNIEEIAAGINTRARVCGDDNLDADEVREQLGKETEDQIATAMEVAERLSNNGEEISWREVYNFMYPPRKGAAAPGVSGGIPVGEPKTDIPGQTTDGVDIDEGNNGNGNGARGGATNRFKINRDGTIEVWYREDQSRDEGGRFADEGGGIATKIKSKTAAKASPKQLDTALRKWVAMPDVSAADEVHIANMRDIQDIRRAAVDIRSGKDVEGESGDAARAILSAAEPSQKALIRGTASGYWEKYDARPEKVLSHFPVGEQVDLTMFSFAPDDDSGREDAKGFAVWATDRQGGYPVYLKLEKGVNVVDVEKHTDAMKGEREHISADTATIKSAKFIKKGEQRFEIVLGK